MGYCKAHVSFDLGSAFHYIGIRFLPRMLPIIGNIKASSLSNQVQSLKDILPSLAEILTPYIGLNTELQFEFSNFDLTLQALTKENFNIDNRFTEALLTILKRKRNISDIKNICLGISPRQLRRLFTNHIGISPKHFSRVIRFQHVLNTYYDQENIDNSSYFDSGYYDQAHFIKDFRKFYGITPTQALKRNLQ